MRLAGPAVARAKPAPEPPAVAVEPAAYEADEPAPPNSVLARLLTRGEPATALPPSPLDDGDPATADAVPWMLAGPRPPRPDAAPGDAGGGEQEATDDGEVDLELDEIEILDDVDLELDADEIVAGEDAEPAEEAVPDAEAEAAAATEAAEQDAAEQQAAEAAEAAEAADAAEEDEDGKPTTDAAAAPREAAAIVAVAATPAEAAPGAGAGVKADMSAWSASVRQATATNVKPPPSPDPAAVAAPIKAVGGGAKKREEARRSDAPAAIEKAVPKAPEPPEGIPPPPAIPVPEAEAAVAEATGRKLAAQTMPAPQSYRHVRADGTAQVFAPPVGANLPAGSSATLQPVPPPPAPPGPEGQATTAKVAQTVVEPQPGQQGSGQLVLGTAPRPGTPGAPAGPPVKKSDVARILGRLSATAGTDATAMLVTVRTGMYPQRALQETLPDLGADLAPGIQKGIATSIDSMREQAGIAESELQTAKAAAEKAIADKVVLTKEQIDAAQKETSETVTGEGKASADAIAGQRDAMDDSIYAKEVAAQGGAEPDAIRARRDRLVERAYGRLAPEDKRYEREGEDRTRALTQVELSYVGGYAAVARQVSDLIRSDAAAAAAAAPPVGVTATPGATAPAAPAPPASGVGRAPASDAENWALARTKETQTQFAELRTAVQTTTKTNRDAITAAKTKAHDLIHAWAEVEIDERASWWDQLWDLFAQWGADAKESTKAWENASNAMLAADMQGDSAFTADLVSGARSEQEMKAQAGMGTLSDAQKAIVAAFFDGPEKGNPLAAIAAGMRVRIMESQRDGLVQELQTKLMALGPESWDPVAKVAEAEGGGIVISKRGEAFHNAVNQWGTDEAAVYGALGGLTPLQHHALDLWYQAHHEGRTIQTMLDRELSDAELTRAQELIKGDTVAADAAALNAAIAGPGTDEAEIWKVLRNVKPEDRARLERIYLERYNQTLENALKGDLSGEELKRGEALRLGEKAKADAIALESAKTGKWYGGADMAEIESIYGEVSAEVEKEAIEKGWTAEERRTKLLARNQEIEDEHKAVYKGQGGLQESFKKTLKGPELDLALGLATVDMTRADAARIEMEKRSFRTEDKAVNAILESQFTRAKSEVTLDLENDLRRRKELALLRGEDFDEKAERAAMAAQVDDLAQKRSKGYMMALEERYDKTYSKWGKGGLQTVIALNMSGTDRDRARALLKQGGKLEPDQEVLYAVKGEGTDVDALKGVFKGKSPAEVQKIEAAWDKRFPHGPKLRDRVMSEVSGRDKEDLDILLDGEPQDPKGRAKLARRKLEYEENAYLLGGMFSQDEHKTLKEEVEKLEKTVAELEKAPKDSPRARYLQWELDQREVSVESSVEEHRSSVDSVADTAAMVASITAAIAVTVLTAGAAGPAAAALMGAIAATEATVATKLLLKGSAYSDEEILVDVASGVVDAALAVATAGMGNALLKVAEGMPLGPLAKLAMSPSVTKRMLAHGIAEGVEGFVSSVPSAIVGTMVDEKTWRQGDMLTNVVTGIGMGAVMGTVMGGAIGSLGGRAHPDAPGAPHLDVNRKPDLETAAKMADGTLPPAHVDAPSRAAQWQALRSENPDLDYDGFMRDLEAGKLIPDPDAAPKFQRKLQQELSAGLPPGKAGLLEGVSVEVLSDADFERMTRSASGQAVTVVEGGKARILMRESADLHVLREEGIHAAQVLDKSTAHAASLLDEANMARWDKLPLGRKIEMYGAKLDLEMDAQHKLIDGLRESAENLTGGARHAVAEQIDAASRNLRNLSDRRVELDGFTMFDRLRARLGRGPLAERLEQPPRLFNKKAPKKLPPRLPKETDQEYLVRRAREADTKWEAQLARKKAAAEAPEKAAKAEKKAAAAAAAEQKAKAAAERAAAKTKLADDKAVQLAAASPQEAARIAANDAAQAARKAAEAAERRAARIAAGDPLPDIVRKGSAQKRGLALLDRLPPSLNKAAIEGLQSRDTKLASKLLSALGGLDDETALLERLLERARRQAGDVDVDVDEPGAIWREAMSDFDSDALNIAALHEERGGANDWWSMIDRPFVRIDGKKIGAERGVLKARLAKEAPPTWAKHSRDWNPHHIIPVEFEKHPVFDILRASGGWDHHLPENAIALPTRPDLRDAAGLPVHQINNAVLEDAGLKRVSPDIMRLLQGHPVYSQRVKERLDNILRMKKDDGSWVIDDPVRLRKEVEKLIKEKRDDITGSVAKGRKVLY